MKKRLEAENAQLGKNLPLVDLGKAVRLRRRASQLKQNELAGLAGVGLRFISDLENGKPGLEIGRVVRVLTALGLELLVAPRRWWIPR